MDEFNDEDFLNFDHPKLESIDREEKGALFHPHTLVVLAGAPKTGKTTIALALANALVHGRDFAGFKVPKSIVGYISYDDTLREISSAVKRQPGLGESKDFFLSVSHYEIDSQYGQERLEAFMSKRQNVVIIIDSLHAAIRHTNPGDPRSIRKLFRPLSCIATRSGTIILLHHTDKFGRNIADHTQIQAAASQNIIHSAADRWVEGENVRTITWKTVGRGLGVPRTIQFQSRSTNSYERFFPEPTIHARDRSTVEILKALSVKQRTANQLATLTGLPRGRVYKRLAKLVASGHVFKNEHYPTTYSLATL
jgi:archaellum biogenesis ATPase FlaH